MQVSFHKRLWRMMYLKLGVVLLGRTDPCKLKIQVGDTGITRKGYACRKVRPLQRYSAPDMPGAIAESLRPQRAFCLLFICKQCIKLPTAD